MALPDSFYSEQIYDNTIGKGGQPESGSFSVAITTLNAGNLAATTTLINNLQGAISALIIGNLRKAETVLLRDMFAVGAASSPLAQRETKWLVRYHGATLGQKFQVSIPTADLNLLGDTHSEFLDLTGIEAAAFKTAFEAVVVSPDNGAESVVVDSIQFVGRNS